MQLNRLFAQLGQGFGIFKAMHYATEAISQARAAMSGGILSLAEDQLREQEILNNLVNYSNDPDWDEVIRLKESGQIEQAQERAAEIRRKHHLV